MSKFLKIVRENSASLDNPNAVFYLKLVDDKGQEIGYEPIQLRGTSYAHDVFDKIKNTINKGSDVGSDSEEDDEIYFNAQMLTDMGDKQIADKFKRAQLKAKQSRAATAAGLDRYNSSTSR